MKVELALAPFSLLLYVHNSTSIDWKILTLTIVWSRMSFCFSIFRVLPVLIVLLAL